MEKLAQSRLNYVTQSCYVSATWSSSFFSALQPLIWLFFRCTYAYRAPIYFCWYSSFFFCSWDSASAAYPRWALTWSTCRALSCTWSSATYWLPEARASSLGQAWCRSRESRNKVRSRCRMRDMCEKYAILEAQKVSRSLLLFLVYLTWFCQCYDLCSPDCPKAI